MLLIEVINYNNKFFKTFYIETIVGVFLKVLKFAREILT